MPNGLDVAERRRIEEMLLCVCFVGCVIPVLIWALRCWSTMSLKLYAWERGGGGLQAMMEIDGECFRILIHGLESMSHCALAFHFDHTCFTASEIRYHPNSFETSDHHGLVILEDFLNQTCVYI